MPTFDYFFEALTPLRLLLALAGVIGGTIVGSLPGLTATMAIAILVPLTFSMEPISALILMGAIYTGAIYGGAFAAILLNTPGTPSAIATTFDGYPMAKRGDGDLAITLACLASVFGGLVGACFLLVLAPPLADVALAVGPVEYFWLAILGLTLIATISQGNLLKGLIGGTLGLLLSCIGVAEISADIRFTFGTRTLLGGIELISALIGFYCLPVLLDLMVTPERHLHVANRSQGLRLREAGLISWRSRWNLVRSSIIGTLVGILPGAGGSIGGLVAYAQAKRASSNRHGFGTGEPEGIQATESANNATVGGGLIPTLVLGIPGTPPDAVILGAMLVQGVQVGPNLFQDEAPIVYTFVFGLLLATIIMLPVGLLIGRYAYKLIVAVPKVLLVPSVAFMTLIGTFAIRNSIADIAVMVILGTLGWVLNRFGYEPSPIVLGLILGRIAEQGFVQGLTIGAATGSVYTMFFLRPLSIGILICIGVTLFYPLIATTLGFRSWHERSKAHHPDQRAS